MDENTRPPIPPTTRSGQPTSDAAAFRALALRLLAMDVRVWPQPQGLPDLLVGQVAPQFPAEVPLPERSRVVGSMVIGEFAQLVLDVDTPSEAIVDFYRQRLPAAGRRVPEMHGPPHGGFMPASSPDEAVTAQMFCRSETGPSLMVTALDRSGFPTDVRLVLQTYGDRPERSPCAQQRRHPRMGRQAFERMPVLAAPSGARQDGGGGQGGPTSAETTAELDTSLDIAEVGAHYARHFERAGWTRTGDGVSGPCAWSTWSIVDKEGQPWSGVFFALRSASKVGRYLLHARVEWTGTGSPSGDDGDTSGWRRLGTMWSGSGG